MTFFPESFMWKAVVAAFASGFVCGGFVSACALFRRFRHARLDVTDANKPIPFPLE